MIWSVGFAAAFAALIWVRLHTVMTYFQQEEYDASRFWGAARRVRLIDLRASAVMIVAWILGGAAWGVAGLALLGIAYVERGYRYKKPLARTERAQRIIKLAAVVMGPSVLACAWMPQLGLLAVQVPIVAIILANRILAPIQARINAGFVEEARAKLARMDPVRVGITGSFGKTTVKHILAEVLEASGPVFYSRGSINTQLGLTRHIRERLQFSHRYFIAEMGAYGIGSVARLCDFVKPSYGIVTSVGEAHTERFGSVEVIARAKSELVADICARGGVVVIAHALLDHAPFAELRAAHPGHVVSVGTQDAADIRIARAQIEDGFWAIDLTWAKGGREVSYRLPLLGDHNVLNSALVVALVAEIDSDALDRALRLLPSVQQIPHRLQKRDQPGHPLVLDDAYNANEAGFLNAIEVLTALAEQRGGRSVLVTPGVAELGDAHERVHAHLGAVAGAACDVIYIVNPERIEAFEHAARGGRAEVKTVTSLEAARRDLAGLDPVDVVLYENDLPDLLEGRRTL